MWQHPSHSLNLPPTIRTTVLVESGAAASTYKPSIMKLAVSVALISTGVTQAFLGPGYEDYHYCPPGDCEIYINLFGYFGPASMYNKCYDTTTGVFTNGVWTGDKTNITVEEGWEEPPKCTAEQYSQCDTAAECSLQVGPGCSCYVSSTIFPFDASQYRESTCTGSECDGYVAECQAGEDGLGNTCMLKFDLVSLPPAATNETVTGPTTPSTGSDGNTTDTAATTGDGGDGTVKDGETIPSNPDGGDGSGQPPVDKDPIDKTSSGNVASVSVSLFVVSSAVFSYLS